MKSFYVTGQYFLAMHSDFTSRWRQDSQKSHFNFKINKVLVMLKKT